MEHGNHSADKVLPSLTREPIIQYRITQSVANGFENLYVNNLHDLIQEDSFFSQSVITSDHCIFPETSYAIQYSGSIYLYYKLHETYAYEIQYKENL